MFLQNIDVTINITVPIHRVRKLNKIRFIIEAQQTARLLYKNLLSNTKRKLSTTNNQSVPEKQTLVTSLICHIMCNHTLMMSNLCTSCLTTNHNHCYHGIVLSVHFSKQNFCYDVTIRGNLYGIDSDK